ncbi:hypothetical protein Tco_0913441 [Tanacetum coccineum]
MQGTRYQRSSANHHSKKEVTWKNKQSTQVLLISLAEKQSGKKRKRSSKSRKEDKKISQKMSRSQSQHQKGRLQRRVLRRNLLLILKRNLKPLERPMLKQPLNPIKSLLVRLRRMYHLNSHSQSFSPVNPLNLDDEFDPLWGQPSQPFSVSEPVQDDSPVEEVAPVKSKYTKRRQQSKKNDRDINELWIHEEEISLCKSWVDVSENDVAGNNRKAFEFWSEVEVRPMGQDMSKKKASSSNDRLESSAADEPGIVEALLIKWKIERELKLKVLRRREQTELKRLKLAHRERMEQHRKLEEQKLARERKQLEREMCEFKETSKNGERPLLLQ